MFAPERLRVQVSAVSVTAYEQLNYLKDKLKAACTAAFNLFVILFFWSILQKNIRHYLPVLQTGCAVDWYCWSSCWWNQTKLLDKLFFFLYPT